MRLKSLRSTMIIRIWGVSALLFVVAMVVDFAFTKGKVEDAIEENAVNLARFYSKKFDMLFAEAAVIARMSAVYLEETCKETETQERAVAVENFLKRTLEKNSFVYGVGLAFEPYAFCEGIETFLPFLFHRDGGIVSIQMGDVEGYTHTDKDWYRKARELDRPVWSEPYRSDASPDQPDKADLLITYSYPLRHKEQFIGVAFVDISLDIISEKISAITLLESGYGFALSKSGALLSSLTPTKRFIEKNISELSPELAPYVKDIGNIEGYDYLFTRAPDPARREPSWIVLRPVRHGDFVVGSVGFVYPIDEVYARIYDLQKESAIVGILGLILLLIIVMAVSDTLTRPVCALVGGASRVAKGDLDYKLSDISSISEVTQLRDAFNKMSDDLKTYLHELQENVAARERVESELQIARHIQSSMLPRIFPPFPERKEFNLHAVMEPAREVGGDFYDFFFITPEKLCLVIGDVSGKGIPAALFMVIAKALLRMEAMNDIPPEQILTRVNNHLCPDNPESMFVTVFCAVLDTATGTLQCANAGHNPPLTVRAGSTGAQVEAMDVSHNLVLGVMPDIDYKPDRCALGKGDIVVLYTDGITEAMDPDSNQFTEQRLKQIVADSHDTEMSVLVKKVQSAVEEFANGAEQSDDITMLALRYKG